MAKVDCFLKLDGIDGECTDSKHKGEIDVLSWSWKEKQNRDEHTGLTIGKVHMSDFTFKMLVSKATPQLMLACAEGRSFKKVCLTCRKAGKEQQEFLLIHFTEVFVSSFEASLAFDSDEDVMPTDVVTLAFHTIQFEYKEQGADGSLKAAIKGGYDVKKNAKL
jgi:type VI secretion system secreted protein Hcp